MDDFVKEFVSSFSQFLSKNKISLKKRSDNKTLISFALALTDFQIEYKLDFLIKYFEHSFYFEIPAEEFQILGCNEILSISENGIGRFAATDIKIKQWEQNFINNWEIVEDNQIPLFIGGMKFMAERQVNDWQNFSDSTWFVPEFLFFRKKDKRYLLYNFIHNKDNSVNLLLERLNNRLHKLFKILENKSVLPQKNYKILKITGNSPKDRKEWTTMVNNGLEKIYEHQVDKIVLSRKVELILSDSPDLTTIFKKLRNNFSNCYLFILHHGESTFIGASPEKLAKFSNGKVELDALAGSAPRGKSKIEDVEIENTLLLDQKNLNEHNFVIEHITNAISSLTTNLLMPAKYKIKKLANIQHLWTPITADLPGSVSMFNLLKELYPTPAICGYPKENALQLIKKLEGYHRGLYSGIIGWFNFDKEGEFAVGIRSALIINNKTIAFAGGGIIKDSEPKSEFNETELKLKTIMNLFDDKEEN